MESKDASFDGTVTFLHTIREDAVTTSRKLVQDVKNLQEKFLKEEMRDLPNIPANSVLQFFRNLNGLNDLFLKHMGDYTAQYFESVPRDILIRIFSFTTDKSCLGRLSCVCKSFNEVIKANDLLWKNHCIDCFNKRVAKSWEKDTKGYPDLEMMFSYVKDRTWLWLFKCLYDENKCRILRSPEINWQCDSDGELEDHQPPPHGYSDLVCIGDQVVQVPAEYEEITNLPEIEGFGMRYYRFVKIYCDTKIPSYTIYSVGNFKRGAEMGRCLMVKEALDNEELLSQLDCISGYRDFSSEFMRKVQGKELKEQDTRAHRKSIYEGDFQKGKRNGFGTISWPGTEYSYTGEWVDDCPKDPQALVEPPIRECVEKTTCTAFATQKMASFVGQYLYLCSYCKHKWCAVCETACHSKRCKKDPWGSREFQAEECSCPSCAADVRPSKIAKIQE